MRKLVLVRGPQGSGKTTLVKNLGLEGFRVSADIMRMVVSGLFMNAQGKFVINQEEGQLVWEMVKKTLQARFYRGEFVIVDATFPRAEDYEEIIEMASKQKYKIAIVDLYGSSVDELMERNLQRESFEQVNARAIEKTHALHMPHDIMDSRIDDHFDRGTIGSPLERWINQDIVNLDAYKKVYHIGDLQGVFGALFKGDSPITRELEDDTFYIFVGDALDRGIENGEVLDWVIEEVSPRLGKNVRWITGNHERHIKDFIEGNQIVSQEFTNRTLPQLIKTNANTVKIAEFLSRCDDIFIYRHHGERVVVTHAGIPAVPENPSLIPANQAMLGVGGFGEDVDERFADWASKQDIIWRQVHGHRNKKMHTPRVNDYSFNLEGQAEFGGHIRVAEKTRDGWNTYEMRNDKYLGPKDWRNINKDEGRKAHSPVMPIPSWIERGQYKGYLSVETLQEFVEHAHVNIREQESRPHIETIAFSKAAFYSKNWDGITNKARGLFINKADGRIIARSWDKFFNLGERPEVELDIICANWKFPITATAKENGFLGLASWDPVTEELVLSSKGSMDGEFAELFREIAWEVLGHAGIERLTRAVRDLNGTATFEVISPTKDPHIVEYEKNDIILLGFINNHETFSKLDHEKLQKLGKYIGVETARILAKIPNENALRSISEKLKNPDSGLYKMHNEGVVLEDADGRFVKVKSGWYDKWKNARRLVERLALQRRKGEDINLEIPEELEDFMAWVIKQDNEITDLPIIELRKRFLETPDDVIIADREAEALAKKEAEILAQQQKEIAGFMRGYDALLERVRSGSASLESVQKLIDRGMAENHIAQSMVARKDYDEIVSFLKQEMES